MVSNEIIRIATERLVRQFQPSRIILLGSRARGTAGAQSNADLEVNVFYLRGVVRHGYYIIRLSPCMSTAIFPRNAEVMLSALRRAVRRKIRLCITLRC
jgi:predicted nucleotidyltransferase